MGGRGSSGGGGGGGGGAAQLRKKLGGVKDSLGRDITKTLNDQQLQAWANSHRFNPDIQKRLS
jgi:hypothetical protein